MGNLSGSELDIALTEPHDSSVDTTQSIPPTYTQVSLAGSGMFGEVHFCLPADTVSSARSNTSDTQQSSHALTSKLVAVKVAVSTGKTVLAQEIKTLRAISEQAQGNPVAERCFFKLFEWNIVGEHANWLITSTLPVCCNLQELSRRLADLPEEFTWFLYTQLHSALEFLHKKCSPAIEHRDLHKGNVVIGFEHSNPHEADLTLPQIKLIDFGESAFKVEDEETSFENTFKRDHCFFLEILDEVVQGESWGSEGESVVSDGDSDSEQKLPNGRTTEFYAFTKAVSEGLISGYQGKPIMLVELWVMFGAFAELSLAGMNKTAVERIRDVVVEVAKSRSNKIEKSIMKLLTKEE